jgi:hypothetical protein
MKVVDPLAGYLTALGNGSLHLLYFIAIWILPSDDMCTLDQGYYVARILLLTSHIVVSVLSAVGTFMLLKNKLVNTKIIDLASLILY